VANKDDVLLGNALDRYQRIYAKAPKNVRNLKNWAMTLYQKERYAEAWKKVKLAEALPDKNQLDPQFIAELEGHMSRPQDK
jgi:hypothetical protein